MLVAGVCARRCALELSHVLGSAPSTRRSTPATRPHGSGRRCRPAQVAPVDSVDPPPATAHGSTPSTAASCSGQRRRPSTVLGSTPSTRHSVRIDGVERRVDGVDPSTVAGRHCRPEQLRPVDSVDPIRGVGSTVSTGGWTVSARARRRGDGVDRSNLRWSTASTRSVGSGRRCRPAGRLCRPERGGASTVSTRPRGL